MEELEPMAFPVVQGLFSEGRRYVPARAVLEQGYPGRVWADVPTKPRLALAWALGRWAYVDGDPSTPACGDLLSRWVETVAIPESRRMGMRWFELYAPPSPAWVEAADSALAPILHSKHHEMTYRLDTAPYRSWRGGISLPGGMELRFVDLPIVPDGVTLPPEIDERFRGRTSFGFDLIEGPRVVARCWAMGFVSGREFMISVDTFSASERGRGYASAVTSALLDYALENGYEPLWETMETNVPSRRLAARMGFFEVERYPVYVFEV